MKFDLRPRSLHRAKISALGTYVPPRLLTNADLEKMVATNDQWIVERTGIRERHIVDPGVATSDLAVEAARVADAVLATDRAQHTEGLRSFALPRNFAHLSVPEQLLVLVDIERVSRGQSPVLGVSARANVFAQLGARRNADPFLPATSGIAGLTGAWSSNYAGAVNTLDANYEWMYTDGWDGKLTFNYDCTGPRAPGCWGHRDNILENASRMPCNESACSIVMGAGYVNLGTGDGYNSYTELFVQVSGAVPALYYTWHQAVAAGARASTTSTTTSTTTTTTPATTTTTTSAGA